MRNLIFTIGLILTLSACGQSKSESNSEKQPDSRTEITNSNYQNPKKISDLNEISSDEAKKLDEKIQSLDNGYIYLQGYKTNKNEFVVITSNWEVNNGRLYYLNNEFKIYKDKVISKSDLNDFKNIEL